MKKSKIKKYLSLCLALICSLFMLQLNTLSAYADQSPSPSTDINSRTIFDPGEGTGGSSWYAPNGGTWKLSTINDSNLVMRPTLISYITPEQVALIQSSNLAKGNLMVVLDIILNVGIDKAKPVVESYIQNTWGMAIYTKFIPYLVSIHGFYNYINAIVAAMDAAKYDMALKNGQGIALSEGTAWTGITAKPYKAIDFWDGPLVYNPYGCLGTFTANP